jgi:SAM-dependent methyltransferase
MLCGALCNGCILIVVAGKFDTILASNLLCRLPNPRKFLADIPAFLKPGGCLVLISPYSWLEEYTPVEHWVGATNEAPDSAAEIVRFMTNLPEPMELVHQEDVDFVIREHERKFQYGVSDCMVWRKR